MPTPHHWPSVPLPSATDLTAPPNQLCGQYPIYTKPAISYTTENFVYVREGSQAPVGGPSLTGPNGFPPPSHLPSQYAQWPWPDRAQPTLQQSRSQLAQPSIPLDNWVTPLDPDRLPSDIGHPRVMEYSQDHLEAETSTRREANPHYDSDSNIDEVYLDESDSGKACLESLFDLQWGSDPAFATKVFVPPRGQITQPEVSSILDAYMTTFFGSILSILREDPTAN